MLQRVASGGDITDDELDAAIPDPLAVNEVEKRGWEELSHWADDADIRAKDAGYASMRRQWIQEKAAALIGYSDDEIARGDYQSWHMPFWVAGTMVGLVVGAAYWLLS